MLFPRHHRTCKKQHQQDRVQVVDGVEVVGAVDAVGGGVGQEGGKTLFSPRLQQ